MLYWQVDGHGLIYLPVPFVRVLSEYRLTFVGNLTSLIQNDTIQVEYDNLFSKTIGGVGNLWYPQVTYIHAT